MMPENTYDNCEKLAVKVVDNMSTKEMENMLIDFYAERLSDDAEEFEEQWVNYFDVDEQ
jgi:hypothetical protein